MSVGTSRSQAEEVTTRLREIEAQRTELADMWRAKEIDRKEWLAGAAGPRGGRSSRVIASGR
jgi:hypothetical protein